MNIIAISDTHGYEPVLPDGDVLIHAGDICSYGTEREFLDGIDWISSQNHTRKIYCPGNHDIFVQNNFVLCRDRCDDVGIDLVSSGTVSIDGIKIQCHSWTPEFCNWAYMMPRNKLKDYWRNNLTASDILVTHGPPAGIYDAVNGVPAGCSWLWKSLPRVKPKIHVFGHIHEGHGGRKVKKWDDGSETFFANICYLDEKYWPHGDPILALSLDYGKVQEARQLD